MLLTRIWNTHACHANENLQLPLQDLKHCFQQCRRTWLFHRIFLHVHYLEVPGNLKCLARFGGIVNKNVTIPSCSLRCNRWPLEMVYSEAPSDRPFFVPVQCSRSLHYLLRLTLLAFRFFAERCRTVSSILNSCVTPSVRRELWRNMSC